MSDDRLSAFSQFCQKLTCTNLKLLELPQKKNRFQEQIQSQPTHYRHCTILQDELRTLYPVILSPIFQRHGIEFNNKYQKKELITIYPTEYFCPLNGSTGELNLTNNSYAIHLFNGAWREKSDVEFSYYYKKFYLYCPGLFPYFFRDKLSKSYASYKIGGCKLFYSKLKKYLAKQYK